MHSSISRNANDEAGSPSNQALSLAGLAIPSILWIRHDEITMSLESHDGSGTCIAPAKHWPSQTIQDIAIAAAAASGTAMMDEAEKKVASAPTNPAEKPLSGTLCA